MQQPHADLFPPVLQNRRCVSEINRSVTALASICYEAHLDPFSVTKPLQPSQELATSQFLTLAQ